ncbi:MAG: SDR family NAD(P)-dependent oxidoreductase [Saprospiraceae bacterium]
MKTPSLKVLVTGATGFVGSYLIRLLLEKGYVVRGLRRAGSNLDLIKDLSNQVDWCEADLTDVVALEEAFSQIDIVFHCAGLASFHPKDVDEMHRVNVAGTSNIVNLCLHFKVNKLIHVSSIAALGRKGDWSSTNKLPGLKSGINTAYAITKHLAEMEVNRGIAEGLSAVMVMPSVIVETNTGIKGMALFLQRLTKEWGLPPRGWFNQALWMFGML